MTCGLNIYLFCIIYYLIKKIIRMFKFATLFTGLASAATAAGDATTTTTGGTKVGAAIEKIYAPANITSDRDGTAEFTKFELL